MEAAERNINLSSLCTNHRASWQVQRPSDSWWLDIRTSCCSRLVAPQDYFLKLVSSFISQTLHHMLLMYSDSETRSTALIWKQRSSSPSPNPITSDSWTHTNDIDCNCLPCEGAPLSYFWFDFNRNLKVWSQTGRQLEEHCTWTSLELISPCVWTFLQGVNGKWKKTLQWLQLRVELSLCQLSFYRPPWAQMTVLTLRVRHPRTYASNLYRINNRMILWQSVQLLWLLCCWLRGGNSQEAYVPGFKLSPWRPGASCISSL